MGSKTNISDYRFSIFINNDQAKQSVVEMEKVMFQYEANLKRLVAEKKKDTQEYRDEKKAYDDHLKRMYDQRNAAGLNSLSLQNLMSTRKALYNEWARMVPGTEEWIRVGKEIDVVDHRIGELKGGAKQTQGVWETMMGVVAGMSLYQLATSGIQLLGNGISYVKDIMMSADSTADKWEETITGLTWGWDTFKKALATGDFTNLISNMEYAIKMGQEYARTLDLIGDRTRALSVNESEQRVEFEKLKVLERDVSLTREQRISAGKAALAIEANLLKTKMSIAKQDFDNEMKMAKTKTGLSEATIKNYFRNFEGNIGLINQAQEYLNLQQAISREKLNVGNQGVVNQGAIENIKKYSEELNKIPAAAKAYSTVVKSIGKLDMSDNNNEVTKLVKSWTSLGEAQQNSIQETSRIKITLSKLQKGIIDQDENELNKQQKENYKENKKSAKEHADYLIKIQKDLQEAKISIIKDAREREKQMAVLDLQIRLSEIKGNTEAEVELRKILEERLVQDLKDIDRKYDEQRISEAWKIENEKWEAKIGAEEKGSVEWYMLSLDWLDKLSAFELSNTELTEKEKLDIIEKYQKLREKLENEFAGPAYVPNTTPQKAAYTKAGKDDGMDPVVQFGKRRELLAKLRDEELAGAGDNAAAQKQIWEDYYKGLGEVNMEFINGVISSASTVLNALSGLNQAMSDYENASLQKDEHTNNKKKENLKRQLDSKKISQKQYDAAITKMDLEMDAKKKELSIKQAKRQKALSLAQAIINVAQAITSAYSTGGPILGIILAALVGVLGAIQIAYIAATPIPEAAKGRYKAWFKARQAADGRYDVFGQDDHKQYRGVPFIEKPASGVYSRPTLFAETGQEIILNPAHTRNLMRFRPDLVQAIMQVPQRSGGLYPDNAAQAAAAQPTYVRFDQETLEAMRAHTEQLKRPQRSFIVYDDIRDSVSEVSAIEELASRG